MMGHKICFFLRNMASCPYIILLSLLILSTDIILSQCSHQLWCKLCIKFSDTALFCDNAQTGVILVPEALMQVSSAPDKKG